MYFLESSHGIPSSLLADTPLLQLYLLNLLLPRAVHDNYLAIHASMWYSSMFPSIIPHWCSLVAFAMLNLLFSSTANDIDSNLHVQPILVCGALDVLGHGSSLVENLFKIARTVDDNIQTLLNEVFGQPPL